MQLPSRLSVIEISVLQPPSHKLVMLLWATEVFVWWVQVAPPHTPLFHSDPINQARPQSHFHLIVRRTEKVLPSVMMERTSKEEGNLDWPGKMDQSGYWSQSRLQSPHSHFLLAMLRWNDGLWPWLNNSGFHPVLLLEDWLTCIRFYLQVFLLWKEGDCEWLGTSTLLSPPLLFKG